MPILQHDNTAHLLDAYTQASSSIKHAHAKAISNIYADASTLKTILNIPTSKLFVDDDCLCILHLQHESFYDLFYLAKDPESLEHGLQALRQASIETYPLRCMIAGQDIDTEAPCTALTKAGFPLHKKLVRRRILPFTAKDIALLETFTADQALNSIEIAQAKDLEEIYALLCEEFDLYGDNIPELATIKENIEKEQVFIIRKDDNIAFIHYFYIINTIYYDYFELTHKDYRQEPFYFHYLLYRHSYLQKRNIKRLYEWRDAANTRLVKMPLVKYADAESIYINFHLYMPNK